MFHPFLRQHSKQDLWDDIILIHCAHLCIINESRSMFLQPKHLPLTSFEPLIFTDTVVMLMPKGEPLNNMFFEAIEARVYTHVVAIELLENLSQGWKVTRSKLMISSRDGLKKKERGRIKLKEARCERVGEYLVN